MTYYNCSSYFFINSLKICSSDQMRQGSIEKLTFEEGLVRDECAIDGFTWPCGDVVTGTNKKPAKYIV